MNRKVEGAYLGAWGEYRRLLRAQGMSPKEADAERHKIHVEVLGCDKSHNDFTKDETDDVIARFRALAGAVRQTDYKRARRIYVIRQICASMGKGEEYAQGIADQMDSEGRLLTGPIKRAPGQTKGEHDMQLWQLELTRGPVVRRLLTELKPEELDKVIVALRKHEAQGVIAEPECVHVHTSTSRPSSGLDSDDYPF